MPSCCYGDEYETLFTSRAAARTVANFNRRGLSGTAADLVALLGGRRAEDGTTLLEVGGGAGLIQVALLESDAVSMATNIDLSSEWEGAAGKLLEERGLEDRVTRLVGDFVDQAPGLAATDLVVMHAVLCCYPDWRSLLEAALAKAKHTIALTVPADTWWMRTRIAIGNAYFRLRRMSFRAYVHPPEEMITAIQSAGLSLVHDDVRRDYLVERWRTMVAVRDIA